LLGSNKLGNLGIEILSEGIVKNKSIKILDLGANNFNEKGAQKLFEALKINKSIENLDLRIFSYILT